MRAEAVSLVAVGVSCREAARRVGISKTTVQRAVKVAGMVVQLGRIGGIAGLGRGSSRSLWAAEVGPAAQYLDGNGRLTAAGRVVIGIRLAERRSHAQIAVELGVHRSTVKREVDGRSVAGRYQPQVAQRAAEQARRRPRLGKLRHGTRLWAEVCAGLNDKFSPQQISGRLRARFGDDVDMQVSHETIYQALYVQGAGGLRHELTVAKALRQGRLTRRPRSRLPARTNRPWIGEARITARPAEVADRAVPGHWEGDLVLGGGPHGLSTALITLVERTSRFILLSRLTVRDSETVTDRLTQMASRLPTRLWRSLTWDQGTEMTHHARFTVTTGCPVFFCDPHSPWQRPTNENSNGLVRDFFPKGTNFDTITDAQVDEAEHLLNIRPRKVLGYATPAETLDQLLLVAPTT